MSSRKRIFDGTVSYGSGGFPGVEVTLKSGPRCTNGDAGRLEIAFFREIDGASESSDSPVPLKVPNYLRLLEMNDHLTRELDDLVAPASANDEVKTVMQTLNAKLSERGKASVTSFREVIEMATKSVELSESLRVTEDKCAIASLERDKVKADLEKAQ